MGFWDIAKDVAGDVVEKAKEQNEVHRRLKEYSDDKLLDIINDTGFLGSSSSAERRMAKLILEKRGHRV